MSIRTVKMSIHEHGQEVFAVQVHEINEDEFKIELNTPENARKIPLDEAMEIMSDAAALFYIDQIT
ncbi:MAG: hypothetical protein K9G46_06975 [Flavobacteriales bacterium]|nr:hypothetical protein [Flavobacteriales bacterium]